LKNKPLAETKLPLPAYLPYDPPFLVIDRFVQYLSTLSIRLPALICSCSPLLFHLCSFIFLATHIRLAFVFI
jgi:hypothetical protein